MRIAVVGSGYVGLVTGACLAETGNDVVCADIDARKIARLRENDVPIYEPGLDELVFNARGKNLWFSTDVDTAINEADLIFVSVNTPTKKHGLGAGSAADLK